MITKELICKGELKSLIESHPDLFSEKLYASNEFNYFVIWLIREKVKGKQSKFHAYLEVIQDDPGTMLQWNEEDLIETQDRVLIGEVIYSFLTKKNFFQCLYFTTEMESQITRVHAFLLQYEELYPRNIVDKKLVFWAY